MAVKIKTGKAAAVLSITPLIDVVFMLLVFFIVTSQFADEDQEKSDMQERRIDVSLPSASEAVPLTAKPKELDITIDAEGRFFVNDKPMAEDEVEKALQRLVVDNPVSRTVNIRPDKHAHVEKLVFVMNACNKVGIFDYQLSTEGE